MSLTLPLLMSDDLGLGLFGSKPRPCELEARSACGGVAAEAGARMWAWRWRQRWGGRYGNIPTNEIVPLGDRRAKVSTACAKT